MGTRGIVLNLIQFYLSYGKQRVIGNVANIYKERGCGVPHGTVLGPVLSAVLNDVGKAIFNCK